MKRILSIRLRHWPVQRIRAERPELNEKPIVLAEPHGGGRRVRVCSAEAEALGVPALPICLVPHPVAGRKPEEMQAIADTSLAEIEHVLTTPSDQLDREYRHRYPEQNKIFKAKPLFT